MNLCTEIVIDQTLSGRLANRMGTYMYSRRLLRLVPGARLTGEGLPEWGIHLPPSPRCQGSETDGLVYLKGHDVNEQQLLEALRTRKVRTIVNGALALRLDLMDPVGLVRTYFSSPPPTFTPSDDFLVIHIRLGDTITVGHPDYRPLPLAYYRSLIKETGLRPLFVGELGDDHYSQALAKAFPKASFYSSGDAMKDFSVLRASRYVCLAVSTFSWMAAWLSERAQRIFFPVCGFMNPLQRPDVALVPLHDTRYSFTIFPVVRWEASADNLLRLIDIPDEGLAIAADRLGAILKSAYPE